MQKGDDKSIFQLPENYYVSMNSAISAFHAGRNIRLLTNTFCNQPDKYKHAASSLGNRFNTDDGRTITVRNIAVPNLQLPMELPYNDQFSLFVPKHRRMSGKLIDVFMSKTLLPSLKVEFVLKFLFMWQFITDISNCGIVMNTNISIT